MLANGRKAAYYDRYLTPTEVRMAASPLSRPGAALILTIAASGIRLATNALHLFNFNPMGASGIFGGARLAGWLRYVLPVALWLAGDFAFWAIRGCDPEYLPVAQSWWWVNMASLGLYVALGRWVGESRSWGKIGAASILGAVQFFLITNFGAWVTNPQLYPPTAAGLAQCYLMGLEFAWPSLASDLLFTPALFAMHEWAVRPSEEGVAASSIQTVR